MKHLLRFSVLALAVAACNPKSNGETEVPGHAGGGATTTPDATAEVDDSPALPMDPAVKVGTLDNGLTYYIRKHQKPEKRVLLWLAVNAGSVLEEDDQRGLAHFVEHMAFNGTKRFEKNTMIDFFERAGMDFGADVNAGTSFDQTVYMLQVPTDDDQLLTTGFDVLEDWAGAVTFDPVEVDKERGVVIEEWRLGRGAGQRVFDKQWPVFLAGSKYAERKPIGDKKILETAPVSRLQDFYRDWYRPNNMAVVVVGDIDPAKVQSEIEQRFSDLNNPEGAPERVAVPVPILEETRVDVQTDKEMSLTQVSLAIKRPVTGLTTENDYQAELVDDLMHSMLRARLSEIGRKPDAPYAFAFSFTNTMGRAVDVFRMFVAAKPGQAEEATERMLLELSRVEQHGFLASELERAKAEYLRGLERAANEADTVDASAYAGSIVDHYLESRAMLSRSQELALAEKYLPEASLEKINAAAQAWAGRKDRVISAAGASRDKMPTKDQLLAVTKATAGKKVDPWVDAGSGTSLMAQAPKAGSITKRETIEEIGVSVWTLSNGAKVVVKPTTFKNDEIRMSAISPGGHSLASDKDFDSASASDFIVAQGGVGEHDAVALGKLLAGKAVRVAPTISELEEGIEASASPQDLETMMQLVHLYFTAPRKDAQALAAWQGQMRTFFKNRDLQPQAVFFDELTKVATSDHLRRRPPTVEMIDGIDLDTTFDFYGSRFADAGDFTFVFVGNVDDEQLEELATTYLASLPSNGRKETYKDVKVKRPRGVKRVRVAKGQDPKAYVTLMFHGNLRWSEDAEDDLDMLTDALSIRLREVLREDKSGVYGVQSVAGVERRPRGEYQVTVSFGCGPDNAEDLTKAVWETIAAFKKDGVDEETVGKLKEQHRRRLETAKKENRFWQDQLVDHYRYGTDPRKILELEQRVDRISSKTIQKAARKYLNDKQYIDALLMPESGG